MSQALLDRLRAASVRMTGRGSGFFFAPHHAVTCFHVLDKGTVAGSEVDVVTSDGQPIRATVISVFPAPDQDLAWLRLPVAGLAALGFDDAPPALGEPLLLGGFPKQQWETRTVEYEGVAERVASPTPDSLLGLVKSGQVVGGFSGGAVLRQANGRVMGVMTETRDRGSDLGGVVIPASLCRALMPEALRSGERVHADRELTQTGAIDNFLAAYRGSPFQRVPFGGRSREVAALDAWFESPDAPPYALLAAPAGRGKSALLSHWVAEREKLAAGETAPVFVPISIRVGLCTEADVMRALAERIATRLGLRAQASDGPWRDAVTRLLKAVSPDQPLLVVVDALDEAVGWTIDAGLFPADPPRGLKLLVSARDSAERNAEAWRRALGWTDAVARTFPLPRLDAAGIADVLRRFGPPLAALADDKPTLATLQRISDGGDPLLLGLYAIDIAEARTTTAELGASVRPAGLARYFADWWEQQERIWGRKFARIDPLARRVLDLLALAEGAIGQSELLRLVRLRQPDAGIDDLAESLSLLDRFLVGNARALSFAHPRFGDERRAKLVEAGDFEKVQACFVEWGFGVLDACRAGQAADVARTSPYIVRHLGRHLRAAGAPAARRLELADAAWESAWDALADDDLGFARDAQAALDQGLVELRCAPADGTAWPLLGRLFGAAFGLAQRRTVGGRIHPRMLGPLLRFGVRNGAWCLSRAATRGPIERAEALAGLIPHLPAEQLADANDMLAGIDSWDGHPLAPATAAFAARVLARDGVDAACAWARRQREGMPRSAALLEIAASLRTAVERSALVFEAFAPYGDLPHFERAMLRARLRDGFERFRSSDKQGAVDWVTPGLTRRVRERIGRRLAQGRRGLETPQRPSRFTPQEWWEAAGFVPLQEWAELADLLPWVTSSDCERSVDAALEGIGGHGAEYLLADAVVGLAPFMTVRQAQIVAGRLAEVVNDPEDRARALLALEAATGETRTPLLDRVPDLLTFQAGSRGILAAHRLLSQNFGEESWLVAAHSLQLPLDHYFFECFVECLDERATRLELAVIDRIPGAEEGVALLIARLASFGPSAAADAMTLARTFGGHGGPRLVREWLMARRGLNIVWDGPEGVHEDVRTSSNRRGWWRALCAASSQMSLSVFGSGRIEHADALESQDLADLVEFAPTELLASDSLRDDVVEHDDRQRGSSGTPSALAIAFVRRLAAAGRHASALQAAQELTGYGRMPPELLHELRQPPPDGGQWLLAPAAALKPIKRVEFLAPIAHQLGETPLREAWRELFATEGGFSVDFLMIYARRIAAALAGAPPPLAEALVRDGLVDVWPSLRDAWRDSVASIVADLAPFLPAEWLAPLRPEADFGGGVSSGARSDVFAALACRWAALGDSGAALRWFRAMPYRDHAEDSAATIIANVAPEYLAMWVDEALRTLTERPRYARWCVALQRRMESAPHAAVRNCVAVWLAALPQRGVEPAWVELPAFIGALAPHGDPAAQALLEAAFR